MDGNMREIYLHNKYHLGDCISILHFLINASKINDVIFKFHCNNSYYNQLHEFIIYHTDKIQLIDNVGPNSIDTWVAAYGDYVHLRGIAGFNNGERPDQAIINLTHWTRLAQMMNISNPFSKTTDIIYNEKVLSEECKHSEKYDWLIINSLPYSGQIEKHITFNDFKNIITQILQKDQTFITTVKYGNYPCTIDYNLSVVEIGKLAKNVKNIIGIATGPMHLTINKFSLNNLENFIIWTGETSETFKYSPIFKTFGNIEDIKI